MNKASYTNDITKLATIKQAKERYKLSRNILVKLAEENNAVHKFGRAVRIDVSVLDKAIEENY